MVTLDIGNYHPWPNLALNCQPQPRGSSDTVLASTPLGTYSKGQSWASTSFQLVWEGVCCIKQTIWSCKISSFILLDQIWPKNAGNSYGYGGSSGTVLASTPLDTCSNVHGYASTSFQLVWEGSCCIEETMWSHEISMIIILSQIWPKNAIHSPGRSSVTVLTSTPLGTYSNRQGWASTSVQLVWEGVCSIKQTIWSH